MSLKIIVFVSIGLLLLCGCSDSNTSQQEEYNEVVSYCDSSLLINENGCPPDMPICVNNEICVEST